MQKRQITRLPFFLILLPVYYLLHLLIDYHGLFSFGDLRHSYTFIYISVPLVIFTICSFGSNFFQKIVFPIFIIEVFFFFFSIFMDIAKKIHPSLGRYSVLLPLMLVMLFVVTVYILRSKKLFPELTLYLNVLFIILLTVDLFALLSYRWYDNKHASNQNLEIREKLTTCPKCEKPDIYFIILDGHSSSNVINKIFNYNNSKLDDSLKRRGFFVAKNSNSNYNSTAYSIAATLQMNYHKKAVPKQIETLDFLKAQQLIDYNPLCTYLQKEGYDIINYSIFPVLKNAPLTQTFKLADPESILQSQTFWYYFKNDLAWNFKLFGNAAKSEKKIQSADTQRNEDILNTKRTIEGIKKTSAEFHSQPIFVYGHLLLPHAPYFFDSTGNKMPATYWLSGQNEKDKYLQQLIYTRSIIDELSISLQKEAKKPRVIIIQGDHGYQFYPEFGKESELNKYSFSNLNAIYFPDNDYSQLYDSISSVNTFRVILHKYFHQDLPLLKDTSYFSTTR